MEASHPTPPSVEDRLDALEHLLAVCAARLVPAAQIDSDRAELRSVMGARSLAGLDGDGPWVRSQGFCAALDELLAKVQSLQV